MKILKHIFRNKTTKNSKYEPNTLAEINGSPDLRLATTKEKESAAQNSTPKSPKKATKKSAARTDKKTTTKPVEAIKIEEPVLAEPVASDENTLSQVTKSSAKKPLKSATPTVVTTTTTTKSVTKKPETESNLLSESIPATNNKSPSNKVTSGAKKPSSIKEKEPLTTVNTPVQTVENTVESNNTPASTTSKGRTGKFEIKKSKDGRFVFNLYASNGVIVATSQIYSSSTSAMNGIKSVMANAKNAPIEDQTLKNVTVVPFPKWEIYQDKGEQYRFRLCASNGSCVCHSQGYTSKTSCKKGIESIIKFAGDAEITKAYLEKKDK